VIYIRLGSGLHVNPNGKTGSVSIKYRKFRKIASKDLGLEKEHPKVAVLHISTMSLKCTMVHG